MSQAGRKKEAKRPVKGYEKPALVKKGKITRFLGSAKSQRGS